MRHFSLSIATKVHVYIKYIFERGEKVCMHDKTDGVVMTTCKLHIEFI